MQQQLFFQIFDKALTRRFDAIINFDRYSKEDLIEVGWFYFSSYIKKILRVLQKTLDCLEKY